jgi:putative hemolysin
MSMAIWLAIGASLLGSFVSTLHFALRDFSLRKLEVLARGNGGMTQLRAIVDNPDGYALSLGAIRVLSHVTVTISILIAMWPPEGAPTAARLLLAGGIAALALYIFGLVLPLSVARHRGEHAIHSFAWFIRFVHTAALPVRWLGVVDEAVRRLAGAHDVTEREELEEELLDAVTEGERGGSLGEAERSMIENVVEMSSVTTAEIMTPRTEIEGVELTDDLDAIRAFIEKAGHSRIPVWEGDPDHISGMLYAKDLLAFVGQDASAFQLKPVLREAIFVPESKPVNELLVELQQKKVHIAIVLDEYGGTAGLVTLEDVVEEIVGEIEDEYEPEDEQPPEIKVDEESRSAEIEARAYVRDVNDALEPIGVELPEDDDYDTIGGYVLSVLGHIPQAGEAFQQNGHAVTVLEAEPTRVQRLLIEAREPEPEPVEEAPD